MSSKENSNWLDDAFDDQKAEEELQEAKRARNMGCLVSLLLVIFAFVAIIAFSCSAITVFS